MAFQVATAVLPSATSVKFETVFPVKMLTTGAMTELPTLTFAKPVIGAVQVYQI